MHTSEGYIVSTHARRIIAQKEHVAIFILRRSIWLMVDLQNNADPSYLPRDPAHRSVLHLAEMKNVLCEYKNKTQQQMNNNNMVVQFEWFLLIRMGEMHSGSGSVRGNLIFFLAVCAGVYVCASFK